jgi:hypothetical protein
VLVCLIVLAIVSTSVQIFATSLNSHTERILFITDDTECNRMKSVEAFHSNDVIADVLTREAVDADMLSSYGAVILPYGEENNTVARAAYENGSVVYLYGELTIKDYKDSVGVDEYALTMPIYKESGTREEIVQFFLIRTMKRMRFSMCLVIASMHCYAKFLKNCRRISLHMSNKM